MSKTRRQFTPEEKHSILQEAEREGHTETCRKYKLAASVLSYWKKKYLTKGKDGLKATYYRVDPKVRELEEENFRLKKIVAKLSLEMEVKDELLKKTNLRSQKERK
jgi:transposase-like protein